jgi:hypothetical protein
MTNVVRIKQPLHLIERFVYLRDLRTKFDSEMAAYRKETYDDEMNAIELELLDYLNKVGVESIRSKAGTAFKHKSTSVTTADSHAFREYVIGNQVWELADWRPNKTQVNRMVDEGAGVPPGVNYSTHYSVQIRRPD